MTQLTRTASLTIVLLLLASVGTASAECAWVAWQNVEWIPRQGPSPTQLWVVVQITSTKEDCEKAIDAVVNDEVPHQNWSKTVDRRPGPTTTIRSVHKERGDEIVTSYRCLPDSIDPRGPKSK